MSKHEEFTRVYDMDNLATLVGLLFDPHGIENQERRGQQALVKGQHLPKELHGTTWDKLKEAWGVQVLGEVDNLFHEVVLPEGWKIERTDHSMWTKLVDDKGRERASIFYKAAFYDRKAFWSLSLRYKPQVKFEEYGTTNERRITTVQDGPVTIQEIGVVTGGGSKSGDEFLSAYAAGERMDQQAHDWLNANYPEWRNPFAYWD